MVVTTDRGREHADPATSERQDPDWDALITAAATKVRPPVVAQEHVRSLPSGSRPQLFRCDDGKLYAVKFRGTPHGDGRGIFTEQVVALLGRLMGAPVPVVRLITVTAELLAPLNIDLGGSPAEPGLHHGSCWAEGFSDRLDFHRYPGLNREPLAALYLLYSWLHCTGDHQVIYRDAEPHDVLSVDHGHFLPGAPNWSAQALRDHQDECQLDPAFAPLNLIDAEYEPALDKLEAITVDAIADAASTPPAEWGISQGDRVAFAGYVYRRRVKLLASFGRAAG